MGCGQGPEPQLQPRPTHSQRIARGLRQPRQTRAAGASFTGSSPQVCWHMLLPWRVTQTLPAPCVPGHLAQAWPFSDREAEEFSMLAR